MGDDETKLTELAINVKYLREAIERIDAKLTSLSIESRLAVIEDRLKLIYLILGTVGTTTVSIAIWLLTRGVEW